MDYIFTVHRWGLMTNWRRPRVQDVLQTSWRLVIMSAGARIQTQGFRDVVKVSLCGHWINDPTRCLHYSDVIMSAMVSQSPVFRLLKRFMRRRLKKKSKLHVTGLCEGYPPVTGGFPSQRASNTKHVSIWWRHHDAKVFTFCDNGKTRTGSMFSMDRPLSSCCSDI